MRDIPDPDLFSSVIYKSRMSVLPISSFPNTVDSEIDWKIIVLKKSYHLKCVVEKRVLDQTRNKHAQFWVRKKTQLLMVQKCRLSPGLHTSPEILVEQNFPVISEVKKIYKEIARDFLVTIFPPTKGKRAFFLGPPVTSGGQHVCDQLRRDWSQAAWRWVGMFGMVQRCYR